MEQSSNGAIWVRGETIEPTAAKPGGYIEYVNLGVGPARVRINTSSDGIGAVILAADGKTVNFYGGASAEAIVAKLHQLTRE